MRVCPCLRADTHRQAGSCACTTHLLKVGQGDPAKPDPNCNYLRDNCALETDRFPHTGVSKGEAQSSRLSQLVIRSGEGQNTHNVCFPGSIFGAGRGIESNATGVRA
jgi:hypothetical protein